MALRMLGAALVTVAHAEEPRKRHEWNPHGAAVTEVHMVLSSHFDAGCKTPGCTLPEHYNEGEPRVCAKVGAGNAHGATDPFGTGEPWAYHIVNRCTLRCPPEPQLKPRRRWGASSTPALLIAAAADSAAAHLTAARTAAADPNSISLAVSERLPVSQTSISSSRRPSRWQRQGVRTAPRTLT